MAEEKSMEYIPESGMTSAHFKVVQEVAQKEQVIAVVRNTNRASTTLIEMGCPGKPMTIEAHTDSKTGVVTVANNKELKEAYKAGYFVLENDGVARREVVEDGKTVKQELRVENPFWEPASGQIIDPKSKKPLVGDYDIHGVINPKNPGQNISLAVSNGEKLRNVESPIVRNFRKIVNAKLDRKRMFHGAQDQYAGFRGGATVFFPDGTVRFLESAKDVKAFYNEIGRQTRMGKYQSGPLGPSDPIPRISGLRRTTPGLKGALQNQDVVAMLGQLLGAGLQWLGDKAIQSNVEEQLNTTHAKAMAEHFSRGNGVLVIIHLQEWEQPDFNGMRGRALLGVSIEGGPNERAARDSWHRQLKLLPGPAKGWRLWTEYVWIAPPQ